MDRTKQLEQDIIREYKGSLHHLIRLFIYVIHSAKIMCTIFLSLTILLSVLQPVLAWLWGRYIDRASRYLPGGTVLPMILLVCAYYLIGFLCDLLRRYTLALEDIERLDKVQMNRLQEDFDTRVYHKITSLSPEYLEVPKINDTIKRVFDYTQNGWDGMNREVIVNGYMIIAKVVSVICITLSLWIFHPWLATIVLIAPIPILYTTYVENKLRYKLIKDNTQLVRFCSYYQDLMLGPAAKEIKTLGLHDFFFAKWRKLCDEYMVQEKSTQIRSSTLNSISSTISTLAAAGANILAITMMAAGRISLGALGAVMTLVRTLIQDTGELYRAAATFVSKKNEAAAFFDLMDLQSQRTVGNELGEITMIEARNLRYRYPLTRHYILDNLNLHIGQGEKVAIVGENGAGKSTFIKLVCGMVAPSDGDILINAQSIDKINPASHYNAVSAVFQDCAHYNTFTLADNVFLGEPSKPRDDASIDAALVAAGYPDADRNALLGKDVGGTDLSGGQWQKIAIARAYYRCRGFIILDEPTSNLDPLAEADTFRRYIELAKDRTVLLVTHRISMASLCDRIIVFSHGKIVEDGTHETLMATPGVYSRLHQEQSQWYQR